MGLEVQDVMSTPVSSVQRHHTVAHAREIMQKKRVHALPVVDSDGVAVGIVSSTDLLEDPNDNSPLSTLMSRNVVVVPRYADVSKAARKMLEHDIHHLVVTHEREVVGVVSSMDLVRVVAENRLVAR